jgi:hypothetical protein
MNSPNLLALWFRFFLLLSSLFSYIVPRPSHAVGVTSVRRPSVFYSSLFLLLSSLFPFGEARGAEFKLLPSLTLQEEYNDNIFFTNTRKVDDFITTVTPGLELVDRTENLDLNMLARVPVLRYVDNTELDHIDQNYRGKFRYSPDPNWGLSGEAGYQEDSRPDRDLQVTGLVLSPTIRRRQNYGGGIDHNFTETTKAGLTNAYFKDDYSSLHFSDMKAHDANLNFSHDFSRSLPNVSGRMNLNFSRYDYQGATIDYYYATLGMSWALHEKWSFLLDGGGSYTVSEFGQDPHKQKDEGFGGVGMGSLSYKGEKTTGDLTLSYRKSPAYGTVGVTDRASASFGISRRLTYEFYGSLSGGYIYNKAEQGRFSTVAFNQDTFYINPRLRYEFTRDVALEASYDFVYLKDKINNTEPRRSLVMLRFYVQHALFE